MAMTGLEKDTMCVCCKVLHPVFRCSVRNCCCSTRPPRSYIIVLAVI